MNDDLDRLLRSAAQARAGQQIATELVDGKIASRVEEAGSTGGDAPVQARNEQRVEPIRKRREKPDEAGPKLFE